MGSEIVEHVDKSKGMCAGSCSALMWIHGAWDRLILVAQLFLLEGYFGVHLWSVSVLHLVELKRDMEMGFSDRAQVYCGQ